MIISVVEADDFIEIAASFVVCTENLVFCCETEKKLSWGTIMGVRDNFVYSKKDVMVAGVAAAIVVVMLGLGFGLTTGASLPGIAEQLWGF